MEFTDVSIDCSNEKGIDERSNHDKEEKLCHLVSEQIRLNLQEPNEDLIDKIVTTIGVRAALHFYNETKIIEDNGGILVNDGSRRKTPGGVFFHLICNDKSIPKAVIKEIFHDSVRKSEKKRKEQMKERRRRTNSELRDLLIREGLLTTLPK